MKLLIIALVFAITFNFIAANPQSCFASLNFTSEKGHLYAGGQRFYLKGLSWFGFETSLNVVHGLWAQDYKVLLDFIQANDFNAMRLPFYLDLVFNDPNPSSINFYQMNTDLQNLTSLQVLDKLISAAAQRGILIMLDLHSFLPGTYLEDGLWYNAAHPESLVLKGWDVLIKRYANFPNVVAFDLKNEPFATTWNTGDLSTDWDKAAARIGNHIHAQTNGEKYLIFVEGTAKSPPCPNACFYGEDFLGVHSAAVNLDNVDKLVYSPHVYGPSVYPQPYFSDPSFPSNMPAIWQTHYGFLPQLTGNAFVIGEWGGQYSGTDKVWMDAFTSWLISTGNTDTFFWCLNPDSGDTGGLLGYDWKTPDVDKLNLLKKLVPSPTKLSFLSDGAVCLD